MKNLLQKIKGCIEFWKHGIQLNVTNCVFSHTYFHSKDIRFNQTSVDMNRIQLPDKNGFDGGLLGAYDNKVVLDGLTIGSVKDDIRNKMMYLLKANYEDSKIMKLMIILYPEIENLSYFSLLNHVKEDYQQQEIK